MKSSFGFGYKIFNSVNVFFFVLVGIVMLFPYINVLCLSLEPARIASEVGVIHLIPREITFIAYIEIWKTSHIATGFMSSVFITVVGAILGVVVSAMLGYGLAHENIMGYKIISSLVLFTMIFHAGFIPSYMLVKDLGMLNSLWSLIIPSMITAYNTLLMRVFFKNLPASLAESAKIDGATDVTIFFKIVLPLSMPILATVALFYAVQKWNEFFSAIMYITDVNKKPLQVILREIFSSATTSDANMNNLDLGMNIKMATAVAATLPILCVYPFLQKYFTKGVLIGAVKG